MASQIDPEVGCVIPGPGEWPADPQEEVPIQADRLWVDGCFDFFHHGHVGVMLQSRRLGNELVVGVHSDEDIATNKGPTVMSLSERVAAVNASRFSTYCVPKSPYVTSIPWITHYGCQFVTHGDDITTDADGNDSYRFVKKAGRMKIVPRTPGISTTDLVGRMLACTRDHFIGDLMDRIEGVEGEGSDVERSRQGAEMLTRLTEYAAAPNGIDKLVPVYDFKPTTQNPKEEGATDSGKSENGRHAGRFRVVVPGVQPQPGQRLVYVDGGFDLFSSGHISFLQTVARQEEKIGESRGWYTESARQKRIESHGADYEPAFVVAGVHDDATVNHHRGVNYPIMNVFERGLCVVQCAYIHAVIFGAPYVPSKTYLKSLPFDRSPDAVYHGQTSFMQTPGVDAYADAKEMNIYFETPAHDFANVNAAQIVERILERREEYEARQQRKGAKAVGEEAHRRREQMERDAEEERRRREQTVKTT